MRNWNRLLKAAKYLYRSSLADALEQNKSENWKKINPEDKVEYANYCSGPVEKYRTVTERYITRINDLSIIIDKTCRFERKGAYTRQEIGRTYSLGIFDNIHNRLVKTYSGEEAKETYDSIENMLINAELKLRPRSLIDSDS